MIRTVGFVIEPVERVLLVAMIVEHLIFRAIEETAKFLADGFRLVTVTQDYSLILASSRAELQAATLPNAAH